jgi:hypothetical protein
MLICSALYYPGSLARGSEGLVRDNRYYPGKCSESFAVWWQYVRKHYPEPKVVLFADAKSPIDGWRLVCDHVKEPYIGGVQTKDGMLCATLGGALDARVEVRYLDQFAGQYFRPMQRNLVEAICLAYRANEDFFWLDNDAFLNTDIRPLLRGADVASSNVEAHQMTMGSVCFYISAKRLHVLDDMGIDLPTFLNTMLNEGPIDTRMHTLQEGGLYKLFAYGSVRDLGRDIQLSHLSCYDRFMTFLRRNPLDTPEYKALVTALEGLDWLRMPGVQRSFHDMLYPENAYG